MYKSLYKISIYTQFKAKESLKLLVSTKVKTLGDKSRNILAIKTALIFIGPYSRIWPAKLTNHSARSMTHGHSCFALVTGSKLVDITQGWGL